MDETNKNIDELVAARTHKQDELLVYTTRSIVCCLRTIGGMVHWESELGPAH
jgi:hypothetical protein